MTVKQQVSRTVGISPKAKLAGAIPALATLLAVGVHWIVTGEVNSDTLEAGMLGLGLSLLAFGGAYLGVPGTAIVDVPSPTPLVTGSKSSTATPTSTSGTFVSGGFVGQSGMTGSSTAGGARGPIVTSAGGPLTASPSKTVAGGLGDAAPIKPPPPVKTPAKKAVAAKKPAVKKPAAKPAAKPVAKKPAARKPAPKKPPAK